MEIYSLCKLRKLHTLVVQWVKRHDNMANNPTQEVHNKAHHIADSYGKDNPPLFIPKSDHLLPLQCISIPIGNEVLQSNMAGKIKNSLTYQESTDKILQDTKWTSQTLTQVDWGSIDKAFTKITKPTRIKFTKLMFDLNQTNSRNHKFYGKTKICPSCNKQEETFQHITPFMRMARSLPLLTLQSDLENIFTLKKLTTLLIQVLSKVLSQILHQRSGNCFSPSKKLDEIVSWQGVYHQDGNIVAHYGTLQTKPQHHIVDR